MYTENDEYKALDDIADSRVKAAVKRKLFFDTMGAESRPPKKITNKWLSKAESAGMVPRDALRHGVYYLGNCRNASVAKWNEHKGVFVYIRSKFGEVFKETIRHPANDNGYDVFVPYSEIYPEDLEAVDDNSF